MPSARTKLLFSDTFATDAFSSSLAGSGFVVSDFLESDLDEEEESVDLDFCEERDVVPVNRAGLAGMAE